MGTNGYHTPMLEQKQPVNLELVEVILKGQVHPHPTCQLPYLQKLHWFRPSGDVLGFLNRFQTITEIGFYEADVKVIKLMLQQVGWRLNKLILDNISLVSITDILQLCPNLKSLLLSKMANLDLVPWIFS